MIIGVLVLFGPPSINFFYGLRSIGQDDYKDYLDDMGYDIDYKEVIETLNVGRVEWDFTNGRHKFLKSST